MFSYKFRIFCSQLYLLIPWLRSPEVAIKHLKTICQTGMSNIEQFQLTSSKTKREIQFNGLYVIHQINRITLKYPKKAPWAGSVVGGGGGGAIQSRKQANFYKKGWQQSNIHFEDTLLKSQSVYVYQMALNQQVYPYYINLYILYIPSIIKLTVIFVVPCHILRSKTVSAIASMKVTRCLREQ